MDHVDETRREYVKLEDSTLTPAHKSVVEELISPFNHRRDILVSPLERGMSTAQKWLVKPRSLFPFLLKIDSAEEINKEFVGDQILRYRMSPLYMPPLEGHYCDDNVGGLLYRYITGGQLRDIINRLDVHFSKFRGVAHLGFIQEILDTALKKCHWLDGRPIIKPLLLPTLPSPDTPVLPEGWERIATKYSHAVAVASTVNAPHGVIHGDLHPKNILFTKHHLPILIDYAFAEECSCVYQDYAKLEINLQFQVPSVVSEDFKRVRARMYSEDSLILPRSYEYIAASIHLIRDILWKNCLSLTVNLTSEEIDLGYRCQLLYYLARIISRGGVSESTRATAIEEFDGIYAGLERIYA